MKDGLNQVTLIVQCEYPLAVTDRILKEYKGVRLSDNIIRIPYMSDLEAKDLIKYGINSAARVYTNNLYINSIDDIRDSIIGYYDLASCTGCYPSCIGPYWVANVTAEREITSYPYPSTREMVSILNRDLIPDKNLISFRISKKIQKACRDIMLNYRDIDGFIFIDGNRTTYETGKAIHDDFNNFVFNDLKEYDLIILEGAYICKNIIEDNKEDDYDEEFNLDDEDEEFNLDDEDEEFDLDDEDEEFYLDDEEEIDLEE